jgi:hypothetical protein
MRYLFILFGIVIVIFALNSDARMGIDLGIYLGTGIEAGGSPPEEPGTGDTMLWWSGGDTMLWWEGGDTMLWWSTEEASSEEIWDNSVAVFDHAAAVWSN